MDTQAADIFYSYQNLYEIMKRATFCDKMHL